MSADVAAEAIGALGGLAPGRECGGCVACCEIPQINDPQLTKPAGMRCPNCTGSACAIYASRPHACRTWTCMWRRLAAMPEELRPDKAGVMFWIDRREPAETPFDKAFIIGEALEDPAAFSTPLVRGALETFAQTIALPIWLAFRGERRLIYPDPQFQAAILHPATTPWQSLVPAALAWRKSYGMD